MVWRKLIVRTRLNSSVLYVTCQLFCIFIFIFYDVRLCIYTLYIIFYSQYNLNVNMSWHPDIYIWTCSLLTLLTKRVSTP